ncbi:polysaccharide biosynthesis tyrosine autokinase [Hyalangium sp. s54d21]|uniref:non-specific protein-tyrosine kinase n=2 Tax=Hyalangium rubrum TaxID=3103134 RepID=A0ABU5H0S6_9BACT|nr:polysaccharide biosynthesis tyrosine autokinase [Hyalangium sp. s54d21]MDY7227010.1 polysaccharide biosynthesis tyrosine autokinase [Hyalangium sp. s54d21]
MRFVRAFWRRKWIVLGVAVLITGLAALHTLRKPKVYAASTSLIIDVTAPRVLDSEVKEVMGEERSNYWFNKEYYATQNEVITSRAVSTRVVEKLGLQHDAAFLGLSHIQDEKERMQAAQGGDAAGLLQSRIRVMPVKDSRVVNIGVEDLDPQRAALLANEVAEAYMAENLALRLRTTESATQWLEERKVELEKASKSSELTLYDFKKREDMLSVSPESRKSSVNDRINTYEQNLTQVRMKLAALQGRVDAIRQLQKSSPTGDETWAEAVPGAGDSAIQEFKRRYIEQRAVCVELSERYLPEHPKMLECNSKLGVVREDFVRSLNNVVRKAETELAQGVAEEKHLLRVLAVARDEAFQLGKKQIEFENLHREAENNRRLYELVLRRLKDIELSGLLRTTNVRVLDPARPNFMPIQPNVRRSVMMALIFGLVIGCGVVVLLEFLENTVRSQADVEEQLGLAFLGFLPSVEGKAENGRERDLYVHNQPKSSVAECCRAIRTNLLFMSPDKPFKTLVVTSSGPQEGKSTNCIFLGVAMAQSGNRVLLLDTDMRRPRLHKSFGVPNDVGISSLVVGEGTLDKAVKSTEVPNLFVLPCGPIPPNPAELLHTQAFADLLKAASEKFDRVILDSPPLNAVSDSAVLATRCDGVVLVLRAGKTNRESARRALRSLADVQATMYGAILNDLDLTDGPYRDSYLGYRYYGHPEESKDGVASS